MATCKYTSGRYIGGGCRPTPEYTAWNNLKSRCNDPSHPCYASYGGRGITVCERWMNSFEDFLSDMGERPGDDLQIDRIDNDAGYSKENCRWTTRKVQANNTRNNVNLTYQGRTQTIAQWAEELEIKASVISGRLNRGWTVSATLDREYRGKLIEHGGMSMTMDEWAAFTGMNKSTIKCRIERGWTVDKALTTAPRPRAQ